MARELSRVFRIFAVENTFDVTGIRQPENPGNVVKRGPDSFCPEWPFLSRFPGLLVPGGITYHVCREMPLNRKFGKIKVERVVVRKSRTTKDDYLTAGNKTIKIYGKNFGN